MCEAKPGIRCASDGYKLYKKAKQQVEANTDDTKTERLQASLAQHDHEFSVMAIKNAERAKKTLAENRRLTVPFDKEKAEYAQAIVEREQELAKDPDKYEALKREGMLRDSVLAYNKARKKNPDVAVEDTSLWKNPQLAVDVLSFLSSTPHNQGGRDLTEGEAKALEEAKNRLATPPAPRKPPIPAGKVQSASSSQRLPKRREAPVKTELPPRVRLTDEAEPEQFRFGKAEKALREKRRDARWNRLETQSKADNIRREAYLKKQEEKKQKRAQLREDLKHPFRAIRRRVRWNRLEKQSAADNKRREAYLRRVRRETNTKFGTNKKRSGK